MSEILFLPIHEREFSRRAFGLAEDFFAAGQRRFFTVLDGTQYESLLQVLPKGVARQVPEVFGNFNHGGFEEALDLHFFAEPSLKCLSSLKTREAEFMQKRRPVGRGPSSKIWPRWQSQRAQRLSVRSMPWLRSMWVMTFSWAMGWKKLGQPVPEL